MDFTDYRFIAVALAVIAGVIILVWYSSKPKLEPTSTQTDIASMASLQNTMKSIATTVEGFQDEFLSDETVYKDTNVQNLARNATVSMNLLVAPKNQALCTRTPTKPYELINNIDSVINQAFSIGIDLSNNTYPTAIANLMLIRLSLVGVMTYKKNYMKVNKNETGDVMSIMVLPGLQRHIITIVDKIFDEYESLPMNVRMYVDANKERIDTQFNITQENIKPKKKQRASNDAKDEAKMRIQSSFARTMPVSTFVVVMVLLASRIEKPDCSAIRS